MQQVRVASAWCSFMCSLWPLLWLLSLLLFSLLLATYCAFGGQQVRARGGIKVEVSRVKIV